MSLAAKIAHTVEYLGSKPALKSLELHCYWPKWNGPWWQMLLLHEMGETSRIPEIAINHLIAALNRLPIKIFPTPPAELPSARSLALESACHCQVGTVYGLLAAWGVDVDKELPWIRPWFPRYQMADGGLTCDNDAYGISAECPSSMVGTISVFEAMLMHTRNLWSEEESAFLDGCARFLIERKLILGSASRHNAEERAAASLWMQPCFPRFYFYDVLRGLNALLIWSEQTGRPLPPEAIRTVVEHFERTSADGSVRIERVGFAGRDTLQPSADGSWSEARVAAKTFPLLNAVSQPGEVSPYLSWQWQMAKLKLADLGFKT